MIESKDNQKFKSWLKLKQKKYRDQMDQFLVYGETLVCLATKKGIVVEVLTTNPNKQGTLISKRLMDLLSVTETSYDVCAICHKFTNEIKSNSILVLDDVQNPDNVGALLRSALAFGFLHIIFSPKTADLYNDKVIRASGGALFDLMIERKNIQEFIKNQSALGYQIFGADAHSTHIKPRPNAPLVLVLGNEGQGLSSDTKKLLDGTLNIKTQGVESLNVGVAGSILMYEWSQLK